MAPPSRPKLLAQGKPRTMGGSSRPWRVRLYAPSPGSNKYQVMLPGAGRRGRAVEAGASPRCLRG